VRSPSFPSSLEFDLYPPPSASLLKCDSLKHVRATSKAIYLYASISEERPIPESPLQNSCPQRTICFDAGAAAVVPPISLLLLCPSFFADHRNYRRYPLYLSRAPGATRSGCTRPFCFPETLFSSPRAFSGLEEAGEVTVVGSHRGASQFRSCSGCFFPLMVGHNFPESFVLSHVFFSWVAYSPLSFLPSSSVTSGRTPHLSFESLRSLLHRSTPGIDFIFAARLKGLPFPVRFFSLLWVCPSGKTPL